MKRICLFLLAAALSCAAAVAANPRIIKKTFDYGLRDGQKLMLDRYDIPSSDRQRPCLIFVFGGGFVTGSRDAEKYIPFFEHLVERGMVVVSIDYRLGFKDFVPQDPASADALPRALAATVGMAVEDLFEATEYVAGQAREWEIDPAKIIACGSSAGAVTVLQAEYEICAGLPRARRLPEGFNYAGIISFAGAVLTEGKPTEPSRLPCPVQMFHGDADTNVPYGSVSMGKYALYGSGPVDKFLDAYNIPHYFVTFENFGHEIAVSPMSDNLYEVDFFINNIALGRQPQIVDTNMRRLDKPVVSDKNVTVEQLVKSNFSR